MKYLKTYNESIRHFLKPKSEEEISKKLDELNEYDKLLVACEYGMFNIIKKSESYIKELPNNDNWLLTEASKYGHIDIVKYLLDIGMHPNPEENFYRTENPLNAAISNGHFDIVKLLLNHKDIDILMIDDLYRNSIVTCLDYKKYDILKYIMKEKEDIVKWYLSEDHGVADDIKQLKNKGLL